MTILNQASDGLPNVLVVLYDILSKKSKPIERDDLLETVAPVGVAHDDGKQARQTLLRWTELGLFESGESGVSLTEKSALKNPTDVQLLAEIRKAARTRALDPSNNGDLWATEGARAADFTRSIAWVLSQDTYRTQYSDLETFELAQLNDGTPALMQNNTRRTGLKVWGQFFGFLRSTKSGFDIDPTVAIRDVLPEVMQLGQDMPVTDFLRQLAIKLPVIDGGRWRLMVEEQMKPNASPSMVEGQLSTSLSRALFNLMRNEEIFFENRADTGSSIVLTGQAGVRNDLRYTWIRRAAEARAA